MKSRALACAMAVALVCLSPTLVCAQQDSTDQATLQALEQTFRNKSKDTLSEDFARQHVADNYVWELPAGEWGRAEATKSFPDEKIYDMGINDQKIHIYGDTAVIDGKWWKSANEGGTEGRWEGIYMDVWQKQGNTWKLIATATSPYRITKGKQTGQK
jgi:hypothetical protein